MSWYRVNIVAEATVMVEADNKESAKDIAMDSFLCGDMIAEYEAFSVESGDIESAKAAADEVFEA